MTIQSWLYGWRTTRSGEAVRRTRVGGVYVFRTSAGGWHYRFGPYESEPHQTADLAVAAAYVHLAGSGLL